MAKRKTETRYLVYLPHLTRIAPGDREELRSVTNPQDWFRWDGDRSIMVYQGRALTLSEYVDLLNDVPRMDRLVQVLYGLQAKQPRCFLAGRPIEIEVDELAAKTLDRSQLTAAS